LRSPESTFADRVPILKDDILGAGVVVVVAAGVVGFGVDGDDDVFVAAAVVAVVGPSR